MKVAIIGASGLVGKKLIEQLKDKDYELILYASKRSKGKEISGIKINTLSWLSIKKVDFAIFSAGSLISKKYAPLFAKKGAVVIDNSSAFRQDPSIPLVVPEINASSIQPCSKIIANPNCSTIQLVLILHHLSSLGKIKRVVVSTYQSASGAGEKGLFDLENKTMLKFPQVLYNDLIPQIGDFMPDGYNEEEHKIMTETQKILGENISICATAVRVPTMFCHGESVNIEFETPVSQDEILNKLSHAKGVVLVDNPQANTYPLCKNATKTSKVYVGRIRKDPSCKNAFNMWIVADNLYKGASTNAIQIMQHILKNKETKCE